MKVKNMKSKRFDNVQRLDSDLITLYEFENNEFYRATIFIDRLKIDKMDLESAVICIRLKVAKGKGYKMSKKDWYKEVDYS